MNEEKYIPKSHPNLDFAALPLHKKIFDLKFYDEKNISLLSLFLNITLCKDDLNYILEDFPKGLSLFELRFLFSYLQNTDNFEYKKILKIEVDGINPHLLKAVDIYNQLNLKNIQSPFCRTLRGTNIYAIKHLINANHGNLFFDGRNSFLKFKIKDDDSFNSFKLGVSSGVSNDYTDSSLFSSIISFSKGLTTLISPQLSLKSTDYLFDKTFQQSPNLATDVSEETLERNLNNYIISNTIGISTLNESVDISRSSQRILMLIGNQDTYRFSEDINTILEDGLFSRFGIFLIPIHKGFPVALFSLEIGIDLVLDKIKYDKISTEELFFLGIKNSFITCVKNDYVTEISQFLNSRGFRVVEIGKTNKKRNIRVIDSDMVVSLFTQSFIDRMLKRHISCVLSEDTFELKNVNVSQEEEIKKYIATYSNFIGRRTNNLYYYGNLVTSPFRGKRQLVKSNTYSVYPTFFKNKFFVGFSHGIISLTGNSFADCINSIITSVFKLVIKGYPVHQVASLVTLLFKKQDRNSFANRVLIYLGIIYSQIIFSIPNLFIDSLSITDNTTDNICLASATGYTNNILVQDRFSPGQKLFLLPIKRDQYNIPEAKYFLKLCSSLNIQILSKNIISSVIIEKSLMSTLFDICLSDSCGFSLAPIDTTMLHSNEGNVLVSVNDIIELENLDCFYVGVVDNTGIIRIGNNEISIEELNNAIGNNLNANKLFLEKPNSKENNNLIHFEKHITKPSLLIISSDKYSINIFRGVSHKYGLSFYSIFINHQTQITDEYIKSLRYEISRANILIISGDKEKYPLHGMDYIYSLLNRPSVLDALNELLFRNNGLILGTAEGTRSLFKLGFLPSGTVESEKHILSKNTGLVEKEILYRIRFSNIIGPWMRELDIGDIFSIPAPAEDLNIKINLDKFQSWQQHCIANFIDFCGNYSTDSVYNPTGSNMAIAAVSSQKGNIIGFVAPIEKIYNLNEQENNLLDKLFTSVVRYFKK